MFKHYLIALCLFATCLSTIAMELTEREDKAARVLQRAVRDYQECCQECYRQGISYRDKSEKAKGSEKDSLMTLAATHFFPSAWDGNVKAQHNLGMICYQWGNYRKAYDWFQRAANQNFEPSIRNLQKLTQEMDHALTFRFSDELLLTMLKCWPDNTLVRFRATSRKFSQLVEEIFYRRSPIKLPLLCLKSKEHPYASTMSYFIRQKLWYLPKRLKDLPQMQSLKKCVTFCQEWGYKGEEFLSLYVSPRYNRGYTQEDYQELDLEPNQSNLGRVAEYNMVKLIGDRRSLLDNTADDQDRRELDLFSLTILLQYNHRISIKARLLVLTEHITEAVEKLSNDEKKEIACYYVQSARDYLISQKRPKLAKKLSQVILKYKNQ